MVAENPFRYAGRVKAILLILRCRGLLLLLLGVPVAAFAGFKPGTGWPEISTPFFHAATSAQAGARVAFWKFQSGFVVSGYQDTGSMRPFLCGGRELLAMEFCRPQTPLIPGQVVQFDRGDSPAVLHYIAAVSRDGRFLYLTGVNCRQSDGWFPRHRVAYIVREIITSQDALVSPRLPAQPAGPLVATAGPPPPTG